MAGSVAAGVMHMCSDAWGCYVCCFNIQVAAGPPCIAFCIIRGRLGAMDSVLVGAARER